jgi:hypothetical protein
MMEQIAALVFQNCRVELVSTETPKPVEDEKLSDFEDYKRDLNDEQKLKDCL